MGARQESSVGHSPRFLEEEQLQLAEDRRAESAPRIHDQLDAVEYATISRGEGRYDSLCVYEAAKTDFHDSNTVVFLERRRWGLGHDVYCCCGLRCIILLLLYVLSNIHACNSTRQYVAAVVRLLHDPHVYL